jgi:sporulation protein YlmC with PRC-barrel domain
MTASAGGNTEINVEHLIGRRVRDSDGKKVGRIEELIAEIRGTDWVVVEVHLGRGALLERLVDLSTLVPVIGRIGNRSRKRYRLAWSQLDLTDPHRPRARGRPVELEGA